MRMLNTGSSAWGVRARMAIYAKGDALEAAVDLIKPAGSLINPNFTADYRFGRVPTLWIGDDRVLQESEAIMDYIDGIQPSPPLAPDDVFDKARMRMLIRLADGSLLHHLKVLFANRNPRIRDSAACEAAIIGMADSCDRLEHYLDGPRYAINGHLTLADCTLVPTLWLMLDFLPFFDQPSLLEGRPKLTRYWAEIQADPVVARIIPEMSEHLSASRAARMAVEVQEELRPCGGA